MLNQLVAISAGISIALNYHHCSSIKVEMAEVGRDIVFTGLSIIAVFLVLLDEVVTVIEAAALVGLYGLYVMLCWHQAVRIKCFFCVYLSFYV
jgi:Ca2+/Na+ antiporter